ncbi:MAG: stage II sporulation protein R [Pseudoflavonifractor sp.]
MDGTFKKGKRLRRWELALLMGLALASLMGASLGQSRAALAEKVIRLHVVANSDSAADQAVKLLVRDRILAESGDLFAPGGTPAEAEEKIKGALPRLAAAGAEVLGENGKTYPVTASLEHHVWFPTKTYKDFALPAGDYTALRLVLGEGEGQNWWCVVFPPLCLGSVTEEIAQTGGFSPDEIALITGETQGYVIKFKALELLDQWMGHGGQKGG